MAKTALITGASSGIGREFAKLFAADGYDLVLVAIGREALEKVREQIQEKHDVQVSLFDKDLTNSENVTHIYEEIKKRGITVDALVNNAGFGDIGNFYAEDWSRQENMIKVNVLAVVHFTHLFLKDMVARKSGRILNVASTAAFQPGPRMAIYYATKSFVLSFSEAVATELEGSGVSVTTLCPGPTATHFQSVAGIHNTRFFRNKVLPTPKDVAFFGYKAMQKGKRIAIYGAVNRMLVFLIRFLPRHFLDHVSEYIQDNVKRAY